MHGGWLGSTCRMKLHVLLAQDPFKNGAKKVSHERAMRRHSYCRMPSHYLLLSYGNLQSANPGTMIVRLADAA